MSFGSTTAAWSSEVLVSFSSGHGAWDSSFMPVVLRVVDVSRFPAWLVRAGGEYVTGLAAAGHSSDDAERVVSERLAWAFPAGVPTGGHAVFDVVDTDGGTVGYVWIGPDATGLLHE